MKRILWMAAALVGAFLLTICRSKEAAKSEIFGLVEKNYDVIAEACENKDTSVLYGIDGIAEIEVHDGYIVVYCMGGGIAPSSQDYGFYYSEDNCPAAIDCNEDILCDARDLKPKGKGYQYLDSGQNVFYTEHIIGNIYFYSTAY